LRFAHAASGSISVDGRRLGATDPTAWRSRVSWVPQDPTIFAGTVADNLRLGAPGADDAALLGALRTAGAGEFVDELPEGIDTLLGEGGLRLSGGQRQRLAIARALVRDTPVVLLDEYTAQLDHRTAEEVDRAVHALLAGRTALVVAHRLRTAMWADRVAVMEAGRVVDVGRHEDLLDGCATYARLVADHRDGFPDGAAVIGTEDPQR